MLFNNARCRALTPEYVNTASGLELHQFKWLADDDLIGQIPARWNHLVGYSERNPDAALVHFTLGGPYFDEFRIANMRRNGATNYRRCCASINANDRAASGAAGGRRPSDPAAC